jgi:hypothetical protein
VGLATDSDVTRGSSFSPLVSFASQRASGTRVKFEPREFNTVTNYWPWGWGIWPDQFAWYVGEFELYFWLWDGEFINRKISKNSNARGYQGMPGGGGMLKLFASSVLTRLLNLLILLTTWPFKWFIKYNMTSSVHVNEPTSHNRRNISGSLWEFFEIYSAIGLVYSLTAPFLTIQRYFDTSSLSFGEAMSVLGILALETPHKW